MAAATVTLAAGIVTSLNGPVTPPFSLSFTAVRGYQPVYDLGDFTAIKVTVIPKSLGIEVIDRAKDDHEYTVDIAVQQKVNTGSLAALDALMLLVEEIADFLRDRETEVAAGFHWSGIANDPIFDPEHLNERQQFTSVLSVTYRKRR